jgi:hypothetical protein
MEDGRLRALEFLDTRKRVVERREEPSAEQRAKMKALHVTLVRS